MRKLTYSLLTVALVLLPFAAGAGIVPGGPTLAAHTFSGADAAAKTNACFAALPSTGGTCDARGMAGAQTWASNPFSGVTKPVTLLLGAATFTFSVDVAMPSNSKLRCEGPGVTILKVANSSNVNITNSDPTGGNSSIVLENCEVDGNRANQTAGFPVRFRGVTGLWILNNHVHDGYAGSISLDNNAAGAAGRTVFIVGNRVENTTVGTQFPIQVGPNWSQVLIENNYLRGAADSSIGVDGAGYVTVRGNLIDTGGAGIEIEDSSNNGATRNIQVVGNTIRSLTDAAQDAIRVVANNADVLDVLVEGNLIDNVERGIFVQRVGTAAARRVKVRSNIVHDLKYGCVHVDDSTEVEVADNLCYNGGKDTLAAAVDRAGILIRRSTDVLVSGNRGTDFQGTKTQTYGLYLTGTTGQVWVLGNDFRGNLTGEIFDDSSGGNIAKQIRSGLDHTFSGGLLLDGSGTITANPPSAAANTGWKASLFTTGYAFGVATSTVAWKISGDWFGLFSGNPANDGSAGTPDTGAIIAFGGTGGNLRWKSDTSFWGILEHAATAERAWTFPDATGTVVLNDNTKTLTGTTLDAEATGNVLTQPVKLWLPAASCNNATPGAVFNIPTTTPVVAAVCFGTSPQRFGALDFTNAANANTVTTLLTLPSDVNLALGVDLKFVWFSGSTSTNSVVWTAATACIADGEDLLAPTFNATQTVADANNATANTQNSASITGITTTGCAAGETLFLRLGRDATNASDTLAATASLKGVELTFRRAM